MSPKPCKSNQYRSQRTNRCRKKCTIDQVRSEITDRCIKKCKPGQIRNERNRCVSRSGSRRRRSPRGSPQIAHFHPPKFRTPSKSKSPAEYTCVCGEKITKSQEGGHSARHAKYLRDEKERNEEFLNYHNCACGQRVKVSGLRAHVKSDVHSAFELGKPLKEFSKPMQKMMLERMMKKFQ